MGTTTERIRTAVSFEYFASPPLAVLLGSCDIAVATFQDGEKVFCTFGKHLERDRVVRWLKDLTEDIVGIEKPNGRFEVSLPTKTVEALLGYGFEGPEEPLERISRKAALDYLYRHGEIIIARPDRSNRKTLDRSQLDDDATPEDIEFHLDYFQGKYAREFGPGCLFIKV
jgi:hypothetical protein